MSPRFSIVTPVFDPPPDVLRQTIDSVREQTFGDWELLLIDDRSTDPRVRSVLEESRASDPRIRVILRADNGGIVSASNDGLSAATGEWIVLLDHDDLLARRALASVARAIDADPTIDYLYSDEDQLSPQGDHINAFYKPDWSPERLRSQNYCCHLSVMRTELVDAVGGFHDGFDGSQDYDLILRVTERARSIHHIPEVLYHWRQLPTSTASDIGAKPYAIEAGRRAIQAHCERIGLDATVESKEPPGTYRVRRHLTDPPLVSVLLPTRGSSGRVWGVERCFVVEAIRSILDRGTYPLLEFVVVADTTTSQPVVEAIRRVAGDRLRLVWFDRPFNFSEKINLGRIHSAGELLLLLNDDVELVNPDTIETMVGLALETDVGSVGAKLLFSDGTLQHAGHVYNGDPYHIFFKGSSEDHGPFSMLTLERECIGVTAAALMIRPDVFDEVGGFSTAFDNNFNDVDFALKLQEAGYRTVWTPFAVLYHFESVTRDPTVSGDEYDLLHERWAHRLDHDRYSNINLEPKRHDWVERGGR
ncbi:MAG: glycosyltransferase family 2 protein [Acidimicrobiia bacterium]